MRIIGIQESDGVSKWEVLAETSDGAPLKVQSVHPEQRGSLLEAALNVALPMHNAKQVLWRVLPSWMRWFVAAPKGFWVELGG